MMMLLYTMSDVCGRRLAARARHRAQNKRMGWMGRDYYSGGPMIGEWLQGGDSVTEQDAATDSASANI